MRLGESERHCAFFPRFQKRRLERIRRRREEKAAERLEQELLRGRSSRSHRVGPKHLGSCGNRHGQRHQFCPSAPPDTVKFGEVALQPPELTAQPRTSTSRDQVSGGSCPGCPPGPPGPGPTRGVPHSHRASSCWTNVGPLLPLLLPELSLSLRLCSSAWEEIADA